MSPSAVVGCSGAGGSCPRVRVRLGVLTKGPVAVVLVGAPLVLYRALDPRCPRVSARQWLAFGLVVLLLAGPWFVAAAREDGGFTGYFFWTHNVVRFVAPFDHAEPVWYFLPGLLLGLLPWTFLLPGLARFVARRSYGTATRRPPALGFFLLAFLCAFAFFSASGCKRPAYILPALPPLALALGCYLDAILPRRAWQGLRGMVLQRGSRLAFPAAAVALAAGGSMAPIAAITPLSAADHGAGTGGHRTGLPGRADFPAPVGDVAGRRPHVVRRLVRRHPFPSSGVQPPLRSSDAPPRRGR